MNDLTERLIRRFFHESHRLSRNRHFFAFLEPHVRAAARDGRRLKGLVVDIVSRELTHVSLSTQEISCKFHVLQLAWKGGRRTTYLSAAELALLREDPDVDAVLERSSQRDGAT